MIMLIFLMLLSACDPGQVFYEPNQKEVKSIELIYYDNQKQKSFLSWVPNHFNDLKPFDFSRVEVIETLDEQVIEPFLKTFSEYEILNQYYAYDSPNKYSIRMTYMDDSFMIMNANSDKNSFAGYIGTYDEAGNVVSFMGCFSSIDYFLALISTYFDYEL